jgi:hypothetical protein
MTDTMVYHPSYKAFLLVTGDWKDSAMVWALRLDMHIREAIGRIHRYSEEMDEMAFLQNEITTFGVEINRA